MDMASILTPLRVESACALDARPSLYVRSCPAAKRQRRGVYSRATVHPTLTARLYENVSQVHLSHKKHTPTHAEDTRLTRFHRP